MNAISSSLIFVAFRSHGLCDGILMPNSVWAIFISAILAVFIVIGRVVNRDGSRVLFYHNIVWISALLLLATNLIAYDEGSPTAWLVLLCGLLSFNVASLLAFAPSRSATLSFTNLQTQSTPLVSRSFLFTATAIYFVAFSVYIYSLSTFYGLDTLLTNPGSLRAMSLDGESYLSRTPFLARLGLNLGPVLLVVFAVPKSVSVPLAPALRAVMVVVLGLTMLAMLQRTNLFMAILWYVACFISSRRAKSSGPGVEPRRRVLDPIELKRRRRFATAMVVGPLILFLSFQFVGGALGKKGQQALSSGRVNSGLAASGLTDIYGYTTSGVPAFLKLVDSQNTRSPAEPVPGQMIVGDYNPQTYGMATFSPLLERIPGIPHWNPIAPFIDIGVLTNVFTWFELPYRDFRLIGVGVYGFLGGFLTSRLFVMRFRSSRIFWIQSAFFSTVFLSIFVAKTSTAIFWTGIIFVLFATTSVAQRAQLK